MSFKLATFSYDEQHQTLMDEFSRVCKVKGMSKSQMIRNLIEVKVNAFHEKELPRMKQLSSRKLQDEINSLDSFYMSR